MAKKNFYGAICCIAMAIIILDTKTIMLGAEEGITLCLKTVIPALFPFIMLSGIIITTFSGKKIRILQPIRRLCNIPTGAESILLLGLLGGYPIGAKIISKAYFSGKLSKTAASRMLGFCSNAGPAFIFGMVSTIFTKASISWYLWAIHIASALTVGSLLPRQNNIICNLEKSEELSLQTALKDTIKTMSIVCGWVIIFRIIIALCRRWLFWYLPTETQVILSGLLELSNGCISLSLLPSDAIKFIFASGMLAFGGLSVLMQTIAVTQHLGCGYYFPGKILQTLFSILYALIITPILFSKNDITDYKSVIFVLIILIGCTLYWIYGKKLWHLPKQCCIIPKKKSRKEQLYAVSKKDAKIM